MIDLFWLEVDSLEGALTEREQAFLCAVSVVFHPIHRMYAVSNSTLGEGEVRVRQLTRSEVSAVDAELHMIT